MQLKRLRGRKEVERVLRRGRRLKGKHVLIVVLPSSASSDSSASSVSSVYVAVSVSKKLAKRAVDRNRMRRRCSEALRVLLKGCMQLPRSLSGAQLLLLPRPTSLNCDFEELKTELRSLLSL